VPKGVGQGKKFPGCMARGPLRAWGGMVLSSIEAMTATMWHEAVKFFLIGGRGRWGVAGGGET